MRFLLGTAIVTVLVTTIWFSHAGTNLLDPISIMATGTNLATQQDGPLCLPLPKLELLPLDR